MHLCINFLNYKKMSKLQTYLDISSQNLCLWSSSRNKVHTVRSNADSEDIPLQSLYDLTISKISGKDTAVDNVIGQNVFHGINLVSQKNFRGRVESLDQFCEGIISRSKDCQIDIIACKSTS